MGDNTRVLLGRESNGMWWRGRQCKPRSHTYPATDTESESNARFTGGANHRRVIWRS